MMDYASMPGDDSVRRTSAFGNQMVLKTGAENGRLKPMENNPFGPLELARNLAMKSHKLRGTKPKADNVIRINNIFRFAGQHSRKSHQATLGTAASYLFPGFLANRGAIFMVSDTKKGP